MPTKVFDAFTRLDASDVNAYLANKSISNAIINGAFEINQRNFVSTTSFGFGFDRWRVVLADGTVTYSSQAFTLGTAPEPGYEASNFARLVTSGQTLASARCTLIQPIESVRTFANQTVTLSFWAKAGTGTPKIAVEIAQNFGSGGSPSATVNNYVGQVTLSTSWARYSLTISMPSIAGKVLGSAGDHLAVGFFTSAGSDFNSRTGSLGIQSATIDIWGVQLEEGTVANDFRRNANSRQGELAACQRYYFRFGGNHINQRHGLGAVFNSTTAQILIQHPVPMRTNATSIDFAFLNIWDYGFNYAVTAVTFDAQGIQSTNLNCTIAGATQRTPVALTNAATLNGFLGLSAEL